jgi:hypothetical protein
MLSDRTAAPCRRSQRRRPPARGSTRLPIVICLTMTALYAATALAANPAGGVELAMVGLDRQVYHARFAGSAWVAPVSLGITTDVRPALAAGSKGGLDAAVTATDGRVYVSHYAGSAPPASCPARAAR